MPTQTLIGFSQVLQRFAFANFILALCSYIPKVKDKAQLEKVLIVGKAKWQSEAIRKLFL